MAAMASEEGSGTAAPPASADESIPSAVASVMSVSAATPSTVLVKAPGWDVNWTVAAEGGRLTAAEVDFIPIPNPITTVATMIP